MLCCIAFYYRSTSTLRLQRQHQEGVLWLLLLVRNASGALQGWRACHLHLGVLRFVVVNRNFRRDAARQPAPRLAALPSSAIPRCPTNSQSVSRDCAQEVWRERQWPNLLRYASTHARTHTHAHTGGCCAVVLSLVCESRPRACE